MTIAARANPSLASPLHISVTPATLVTASGDNDQVHRRGFLTRMACLCREPGADALPGLAFQSTSAPLGRSPAGIYCQSRAHCHYETAGCHKPRP
jgi:hypothetical protein